MDELEPRRVEHPLLPRGPRGSWRGTPRGTPHPGRPQERTGRVRVDPGKTLADSRGRATRTRRRGSRRTVRPARLRRCSSRERPVSRRPSHARHLGRRPAKRSSTKRLRDRTDQLTKMIAETPRALCFRALVAFLRNYLARPQLPFSTTFYNRNWPERLHGRHDYRSSTSTVFEVPATNGKSASYLESTRKR